jgi:uncharacterized membrane protein YhiD involved in acid resistance
MSLVAPVASVNAHWAATYDGYHRAPIAGSFYGYIARLLHVELLLGTGLGAAIGLERDLHGRPAGLRTHAIVSLASATFIVISTRFVFYQHYAAGDLVEVDASRIAASVVSGIGFLGAGAILRTGITIKGLTTAASLWLVAAIGMAAGASMYAVAVFVTIVGLGTLNRFRHRYQHSEVRWRLPWCTAFEQRLRRNRPASKLSKLWCKAMDAGSGPFMLRPL